MLADGQVMSAYRFSGYWKDVGTLESLWDANMDMLSPETGLDLLDPSWPIYARTTSLPPAFLGPVADIANSAVSRGCDLEGTVKNSVLSQAVVVEEGAVVRYAILGENCRIGAGAKVGDDPESTDPDRWGLAVLGPGTVIEGGRVIPPKTVMDKNGQEVSR